MTRSLLPAVALILSSTVAAPLWADASSAPAAPAPAAPVSAGVPDAAKPSKPSEVELKAAEYLVSQQEPNGAWMSKAGPGVTALVLKGMIQAGKTPEDPAVKKAIDFIETFRQEDGGYYKDSNPNYNTAIVLSAFSVLPREQYKDKIAKAQAFLKSIQHVEGHKDADGKEITKDHPWYGGAGYGNSRRPDLSNTAFLVQALHDSGLPANDPAIQAALVFTTRCQMNSETNPLPLAAGQDSGGFIYSTNKGGESMFGNEERDGKTVLRAYGSMTYAGLKSMIHAGLTKDDPRVKAAMKFITNNWTLETNPAVESPQGQYYYYHTFAKAMHTYGEDVITDARGIKHDWRKEFNDQMAKLRREDGSWMNTKSERWLEGNPILCTGYVLLALQEAR